MSSWTGRFSGKVALVTGAGSGIGADVASRIAAEGGSVVLTDIDADGVSSVADRIVAAGGAAVARTADITDRSALDAAVRAAVDEFGGLHLAVNNAGVNAPRARIGEYGAERWDRVIAINLTGVFHSLEAQLPVIAASGGGAVVNVSSIFGVVGDTGNAAYTASKHGVIGLTKTAALDWAEQGVRVNSVSPGYVDTPLLAGHDADWQRTTAERHPLGRLAAPSEITSVIAFLLSDEAGFITGSNQAVDGGFTAR